MSLRVTVELIPHGNEKKAETISVTTISNLRHMMGALYEYDVFYRDGSTRIGTRVEHYRNKNVVHLLKKVFDRLAGFEEFRDYEQVE